MTHPFREAGLPRQTYDSGGEHARYGFSKGVVRAVYPELWRVDIEPEEGGLLSKALVVGDVFPPIHKDTSQPSHVMFAHIRGHAADVVCWPLTFRRMYGPETGDDGKERHFYHRNQQIVRVNDITIRITPDGRVFLYDAETDDSAMYDINTRTFHVTGPHIFLGSDNANRIEYHRTDDAGPPPIPAQVRIVIPKCFIGATAIQDQDGISYLSGQLLHLVSDVIKLTATSEIILDPLNVKLGSSGAAERALLGTAFQTFWALVKTMIDTHVHSGVAAGGSNTGVPITGFPPFTDNLLSDIVHLSKT
jgi:hypothetical protein